VRRERERHRQKFGKPTAEQFLLCCKTSNKIASIKTGKKMGRKKIQITRISDERNRQVSFFSSNLVFKILFRLILVFWLNYDF